MPQGAWFAVLIVPSDTSWKYAKRVGMSTSIPTSAYTFWILAVDCKLTVAIRKVRKLESDLPLWCTGLLYQDCIRFHRNRNSNSEFNLHLNIYKIQVLSLWNAVCFMEKIAEIFWMCWDRPNFNPMSDNCRILTVSIRRRVYEYNCTYVSYFKSTKQVQV